jgi:hypothetical protein
MMATHPRRQDYVSDVDYWAACLTHLDSLHPEGVEIRRALWHRIDQEATIARMRELLSFDRPFTDAEEDEYDSLAAAYRAHRREARTARKATS